MSVAPFIESESDMTRTALTLAPDAGQGYSATIQQTEVREKINAALPVVGLYLTGGL